MGGGRARSARGRGRAQRLEQRERPGHLPLPGPAPPRPRRFQAPHSPPGLHRLSQQQAPVAAGTVHGGAAPASPPPSTDSPLCGDSPPRSPRLLLVNFEPEEKQL